MLKIRSQVAGYRLSCQSLEVTDVALWIRHGVDGIQDGVLVDGRLGDPDVVRLGRRPGRSGPVARTEAPEQIVKQRYARGEINREEYDGRLADLRK